MPKHQRRLAGFDEAVISLYAKGMTTGDIAAHLSQVYDTDVSRDLVSRVTDQVLGDMKAWSSRPLDAIYPVILIDAIVLKVREGTVANRPVYVAIGIDLNGFRDVLGLWVGPSGGEGAKQWMNMLSDLKNRGILDACIVCCDGLKGLPEAITATWPAATVQTCVVHLVRNSLRYASKKYWQAITRDLKKMYTAPSLAAAEAEFETFARQWEPLYPAMVRMWRNSWTEFIPFLDFPVEVRKLIYTTNGIESLNARFRAATRDTAPNHGITAEHPLIVDIDATLVTAHSEKELAAPTFKKGFGFHPLCAFLDHGATGTGEPLAIQLRAGNAGSNTAADHITVTAQALRQLPGIDQRWPGRKVLIRTDGAGGTKEFLTWLFPTQWVSLSRPSPPSCTP